MHNKTMDPNGYRRLSHPKNAGEDGDVIRKARTYTSTYKWDFIKVHAAWQLSDTKLPNSENKGYLRAQLTNKWRYGEAEPTGYK